VMLTTAPIGQGRLEAQRQRAGYRDHRAEPLTRSRQHARTQFHRDDVCGLLNLGMDAVTLGRAAGEVHGYRAIVGRPAPGIHGVQATIDASGVSR
jgi:hypothetical protein